MITFSYPAYTTVVGTISLPDPELFDSHDYSKEINVYVSRNRKIRTSVFTSDITKRVIKKELVFRMGLAKMKELKVFLEDSKGEYLKYTDYQGIEWICLIDLDLIDYTSLRRAGGQCNSRDEFFEVSLVLSAWIDGQGTVEAPDEIPTT